MECILEENLHQMKHRNSRGLISIKMERKVMKFVGEKGTEAVERKRS